MANDKNRVRGREEAVLSRARRMFRAEMKKFASALGLETFEQEAIAKKLEEIKKAREQGMGDTDRAAQRAKELEAQLSEKTAKIDALNADVARAKKELMLQTKAQAKAETEAKLKAIAMKAGINDADYALHLLRQHVRGLPEDQSAAFGDAQVSSYFEGLKKEPARKYLFSEEKVPAGPRSLADQAPGAPGGQPPATTPPAPKPGPESGAPAGVDAMAMPKRDFAAHTRDKYNYSPGMG